MTTFSRKNRTCYGLLLFIALLSTPLLSMKRSAQEMLEQATTKKVASPSIKPKDITIQLKNGDILTLTAHAVTLCDHLADLLKVDASAAVTAIPSIFDMFNLTDNEVIVLFNILNSVAQSARFYTDLTTQKRYYHNQDTCNITVNICKQNNLLYTNFFIKVINACDFLICDTLLNSFTRLLVEGSKELIKGGFDIFDKFSINSGAIPLLEKHLKRIKLGEKLNIYIQECNLIDYMIFNNSLLPIQNNVINLESKKLTSLNGLEIVAHNIDLSLITEINLTNNYLGLTHNFTSLKQLPNLTILNLSRNKLTELPANIFNGLVNLNVLDLSQNQLTELPATIFNELVNLNTLYLLKNQLTELPANIFNGLVNLNVLDLSQNQLTELPATIFNELVNLNTLYLLKNQLTELPANIFNRLVNLNELYLLNNKLTELPATIFNGLDNLNTLALSNNQLTELPATIFNGLVNLHYLNLWFNQLTELPATIFNGLDNLNTLDLSSNQLTELPATIFNGLVNLHYLNLSFNQLTELPATIFNGLVNLNKLYLLKNQLTELPANIFNELVNLNTLYLLKNQLIQLPANIFNRLVNLNELDLSQNQLTELPAKIFNGLVNLNELNLNNNQLNELPKDVQKFIDEH